MRPIIPLIFFAFLAGAILYLSNRMAFYFHLDSAKWLYVLFTALVLYMFTGMIRFSNATRFSGSLIYISASLITGWLLYFLISVNVADLLHVFSSIAPHKLGIAAFISATMVSSIAVFNSFNLKTKQIQLPVQDLNDKIRAMHLTDIHIGHFRGRNWVQRIVNLTQQQHPDVVFITGDLFDGQINLQKENLMPFTQIKVPIYFVEGNHDNYSGVEKIKQLLSEIGIHVMSNEVAHFQDLQIIGLKHMRPDNKKVDLHASSGPTIQETLNQLNISKSRASLLLHHSPEGIQYADKHGVDVVLAGHTHAGQMFPVNLISKYIFAYNEGRHKVGNTQLYVSHGAGTFGPPMRLGTQSEITLVTLVPQ